jgi:hypothetical protein
MRRLGWLAVVAVLAMGAIARSETYWIEWDGADWPENMNPPWIRSWGNWQGPHQGGAIRTLEDGILTYDSLYDPGVYDYYYMDMAGGIDPGPGEVFLWQWTVKVDQLYGWYFDPDVALASDTAKRLGFGLAPDHIQSVFEDGVTIPVQAGLFHDYAVVSSSMLTYELYIDGDLVRIGSSWQGVSQSYVGWGDGVQGGASLHHWKRACFGAVVAPQEGDVNCDGTFDFRDINPFVQVLSDPAGYGETYPTCWPSNADMNGDESVDFADINPFVAGLLAQ